MRQLIAATLAALVFTLALATGAVASAADHDPFSGCEGLDPSFCVQEEEEPKNVLPTSGGGFLVLFALLWATPIVLAAVFATRNNENVGTAVALTIFLGWIGLYIAYRGQRRSGSDLIQAAEPNRPRNLYERARNLYE